MGVVDFGGQNAYQLSSLPAQPARESIGTIADLRHRLQNTCLSVIANPVVAIDYTRYSGN